MGSNSSVVQNKTSQNIQTNVNAIGDINQSCVNIVDIDYIAPCRLIVKIACYNGASVDSTIVVNQSTQAVYDTLVEQKANNGMFRFLNLNAQSTYNEIKQLVETNVENKCLINQSTYNNVKIRILITKQFCALPVKVYQLGNNSANCTLNTTMNLFVNADINTTVEQSSGRSGSCNDSNMGIVLLAFIIFFLLVAAVLIFFFRSKRKNKKSKPSYKKKR